MADVHAIFGTLLALGIAFPGMLFAFWLLFPRMSARSQQRLRQSTIKSFGIGILTVLVAAVPITLLLALPFGPAKFLGALLLLLTLAFAAVGAAGMAAAMGEVLIDQSGADMSPSRGFLAGAIALELAAVFPVLGWLLLLPVIFITSLGASCQALLGAGGAKQESPAPDSVPELSHEPQSA